MSNERAQELVNQTPVECYIASALEDASRYGKINYSILDMKLSTILYCLPENQKKKGLMLAQIVIVALQKKVFSDLLGVLTEAKKVLEEANQ